MSRQATIGIDDDDGINGVEDRSQNLRVPERFRNRCSGRPVSAQYLSSEPAFAVHPRPVTRSRVGTGVPLQPDPILTARLTPGVRYPAAKTRTGLDPRT